MNRAPQALEEDRRASISWQVNKWVDHVLGPSFHKYRPAEVWAPPINLYEDENHYCVVVELAGMKVDQIDLHVEKGILILAGERPAPCPQPAEGAVQLHLMEIDHGQFQRRMELPRDADVDAIEASYRSGMLWVRIPKRS